MALRVFGKGYDFTYDFGRYGRVSATRLSGEGILRVWTNFSAFVKCQRGHGDLKGVHYQTTPEVDNEIMGFHSDLIKEGKQTRKTASYTEHKLQQDYDLFDHNCVTICMDAIEYAEQALGVGSAASAVLSTRTTLWISATSWRVSSARAMCARTRSSTTFSRGTDL